MSQKHSEQYKIIGQAIKKYRKQRGLTQEQLADGELERAVEMGETAYNEMKNAPSQDEINAMLMLQIAELKAGVGGE